LRQQEFRPFSTILVDNGSTDGSVEFVAQYYPDIKTISLPENAGFSTATNIALKTIKTPYVALLNNDATAHPSWLKNLVQALEDFKEAGFAASKICFYNDPTRIDRAGDSYTRAGVGHLRGRGMPSGAYDRQEWVFGACAAAAIYRTEMLQDIGFFDEDFYLLYEDVDLSLRAQLSGYRCLFVPEAIVYHKASSSIIRDSSVSVYYGHRNLEWVYFQNMPGRLILKTILPHVIYDVAAFLFFAANGRMTDFVKAKWHALKGLKRAIKKRRKVQDKMSIPEAYLWSLLEKERLLPRLTMRVGRDFTRTKG
jgi:GT2 family glycosyltransferase